MLDKTFKPTKNPKIKEKHNMKAILDIDNTAETIKLNVCAKATRILR